MDESHKCYLEAIKLFKS